MDACSLDFETAAITRGPLSRNTIDMLRTRMFVRPTFGIFVALKLR